MKYSYNWLKELSGTKLSPEKLADLLTMHAFELEEMKKEGKETQLVFDILANRGHDALSHVGLAREICTVEGRKFTPTFNVWGALTLNVGKLKVKIKDKKLCPRYIGAVIENIEIKSSPKWMQERLQVCGVKPVNNVVDITNYVMLETGQPLHTFDASVISKQGSVNNIAVRRAKRGEKIKLLDEKVYELSENNLVIADSEKALALAGVMGGFDSSITKKTTSIILESANFDPVNIRKTRIAHNIITESSYRFERDIDPNLAEIGAARAIELLQKYGGASVKLTAYTDVYPKKIKPWSVKLDPEYVKSLLGENIPDKKIKNILENLGISVKIAKNILRCEIPTRRIDLKTQEGLIEEIGRIYGYENIPAKPPIVELSSPAANIERIFENKLCDAMTALGFSEMMNYSFYSADDIGKCGLGVKDHFEVANPMNPDQQYMRTSLIPGILKNAGLNLKNFEKFSIFEIGRTYLNPNAKMPEEKLILAGALVNTDSKKDLFLELKGKIAALFEKFGLKNTKYEILNTKHEFHPTRSSVIKSGGKIIGRIGEINPQILDEYKIKTRVAIFELNIEEAQDLASLEWEYVSVSKFPSVRRDISMFIGKSIIYADIEKKIAEAGGKLVLNIKLFDIFEKEGKKSMALRLEIGSCEKTLTSAEIDAVMKKIISRLEKDLKVKVRK